MKVEVLHEQGYYYAKLGLSLSYEQPVENMDKVMMKLAHKGDGHSKFLESIQLWLDVDAPRYWWQQFDTYRIGVTKQSECYSDDTELLTENGWMFFRDYKDSSVRVATINQNSMEVEYQEPTHILHDKYKGPMVYLKSKKFDLLVTPNHNMLVFEDASERKNTCFVKALDYNKNPIPKKSSWAGSEVESFTLPNISSKWNTGSRECLKLWDDKRIKMDDWLAFFGFWLAEGRTAKEKRNYNTYVYQAAISPHTKEVDELMSKLPFKVHRAEYDGQVRWLISDKQLYNYLHKIGDTYSKYIPKDYKFLSKRQILILLDWAMRGDGHIDQENSAYKYSTVSRELADDIQELMIKTGMMANIYTYDYDKPGLNSVPINVVSMSKTDCYWIDKNGKGVSIYDGKIHCLETPNSTLLVRRNGKATWCGNSTMHTMTKRRLTQDDFSHRMPKAHLDLLNLWIDQGKWNTVKWNLPESFMQRRIVCLNYMALQRMVRQRMTHKLPEWQEFIGQVLEQVEYPEFLVDKDS